VAGGTSSSKFLVGEKKNTSSSLFRCSFSCKEEGRPNSSAFGLGFLGLGMAPK
jgi:hypothetical protein